jgi:hypothetical protein
MLKKLLIASLMLLPASMYAQSAPAVKGGESSIWAGGEYANFNPDYGLGRVLGVGVVVDYNLFPKWGAEGEARWLHWNSNNGTTQQLSNYLLGPRYRFLRYHHLSVWGKFLMGAGLETYPALLGVDNIPTSTPAGSGSYFAYAPGITGEYQVTHRLAVRGGYEWEFWPSAPGAAFTGGAPSNGLTPSGYSAGVTYRVLGR